MKLLHVAGARPNFMKIAPLLRAFGERVGVELKLVHTGQHYDELMSRVFFDELKMPRPDCDLEVGSDSHARQTARIMMAFEALVNRDRPDLVVVVGDVNSTLACALVCAKLRIPIAHVEAGLRSFDWEMPEEVNRVLTDRMSELLFATEKAAVENLKKEGIPSERVHLVGNVMIDSLRAHLEQARRERMTERLHLPDRGYALVTLHRPANVDDRDRLRELASALGRIASQTPVVFPVHPRTLQRLKEFDLLDELADVTLLEPLGYLAFLDLMASAGVVLTDSGGIQEETTALQVRCLTLRESTERPVTIESGTNRLVTLESQAVVQAAKQALGAPPPQGALPELWDGKAAQRIAAIVTDWWEERGQ